MTGMMGQHGRNRHSNNPLLKFPAIFGTITLQILEPKTDIGSVQKLK
jgi:hypothetical protein